MLLLTNPFICPWSSGNRLVFGRKLLRKWLYSHFYITYLAWGNIKIPSLINISARIWTEFSKSEFKLLVLLNSCYPLSQIFTSAVRNSKRWLYLSVATKVQVNCLLNNSHTPCIFFCWPEPEFIWGTTMSTEVNFREENKVWMSNEVELLEKPEEVSLLLALCTLMVLCTHTDDCEETWQPDLRQVLSGGKLRLPAQWISDKVAKGHCK